MEKFLKTSVSAIALGLIFAGPAAAFDEVDWKWTNTVTENIWIDVKIDAANSFYPTGITQAERLQISGGNLSATSLQNGTEFEVASHPANGEVTFDLGTLKVSGVYTEGNQQNNPPEGDIDTSHVNGAVEGIELKKTEADKIQNKIYWQQKIDLGEITLDVPAASANLNALVDLGRLEGNATAAANLASVSSEVGTYVHDGQIAFGAYEPVDTIPEAFQALGAGLAASLIVPTDNRNLDAVAIAAMSAQFGLIKQGNINAYASAQDVVDAQVALNATGAGNLHTVTVGPVYDPKFVGVNNGSPKYKTDNIVIADLNQFSLMNVSATADASNLTVTGYEKLGKLKDQYGNWTAVSSVNASAFGNMSSITNRVNGLAPLAHTYK